MVYLFHSVRTVELGKVTKNVSAAPAGGTSSLSTKSTGAVPTGPTAATRRPPGR